MGNVHKFIGHCLIPLDSCLFLKNVSATFNIYVNNPNKYFCDLVCKIPSFFCNHSVRYEGQLLFVWSIAWDKCPFNFLCRYKLLSCVTWYYTRSQGPDMAPLEKLFCLKHFFVKCIFYRGHFSLNDASTLPQKNYKPSQDLEASL